MSRASVTSSQREKEVCDVKQELEAITALNASLRVYLSNLCMLRRDLRAVNENCKHLVKVNNQWTETLKVMK